ncbi:hypothetical protein LCGC14_1735830 [marine sediment metagenome]|uniref:Uncharacterized protein n=1 Tax=marine sediment metagenome TaxID=412755 RepID=A0A0F9JNM5_9ZZZZ
MKKRGRTKGSKNKYSQGVSCSYLIDIVLKCCKCKRVFNIVTNKKNVDEVYTKETKKKWLCRLC